MAFGKTLDIYWRKHREYLLRVQQVRVAYDRRTDRLRLVFQVSAAPPPAWLKALRIDVFHDMRPIQETVQVDWIDTEGSHLVAVCPRPRTVLTDEDVGHIGEDILPIGDVVLFAGEGAHEYVLPNLSSVSAFRESTSRRSGEADF